MAAVKFFRSLIICVFVFGSVAGCDFSGKAQKDFITITDQIGRKVKIPSQIKRMAAFHHFGGKLVYALNQQHLLVEKSIYGREALALNRIDKAFAALPNMAQGHGYNIESLVSLNPDVVFLYASSDQGEIEQFENAGIPVIGVKGETFEESFEAIRLMADVLKCRDQGEVYIQECNRLIELVRVRLEQHGAPPLNVMFSGPKSIYSVATGNMLQNRILELSGARNVAAGLKGFWADVSPEQIAKWNPDVVFLGSSFDAYGKDKIFKNSHFQTVKAIKEKKVFSFPSEIGWWDYPAPHCVLGVVWSAKTLYPELFSDIDMMMVANRFYKKFMGYTFEELGGRLEQ
ncbi:MULTISPECIES: ABC transporter substrate-binding protein [Desulfobacula]|uniref:Putaitve iron ABC transporter substrate-binding protein n=2 Tax=Desulfobacula TaxID=28222 RepID=K0NJQ5_DESTT|nr:MULTISPECIES: ABC transporter substrate-binding protein [Desulfobacula]CCK79092.1 putaitve iron ABC transporter substrate-binding protein [Desulfobacula toluolica Tol2]SDU07139.1 iron complex transport system substrate-binding protein [Desulfobacula phenolica]